MGLFLEKQQLQISASILPAAAKQEIMENRLPQLNSDKIFLKKGEFCSYIDKAILNVTVKKRIAKHVGHSSPGLFKGTRVTTGYSKADEWTETKQQKGILYITNKRVVFQAAEHAFDKQHRYLSSIEPYSNAVILQYGQTNYELIVPDGVVVNQVLRLVNTY